MLQRTEYQTGPYLKWFWRTKNFRKVINRGQFEPTRRARLLLLGLRVGIILQIIIAALLIVLSFSRHSAAYLELGLAVLIAYPLVWAYLVIVPLVLGRVLIVGPKEKRLIARSSKVFADSKATKIAVAGSYGKTTMKELLATVLGEGKITAVTPANKNVASSHAIFASKLKGDEQVLVIEFGEGRPGDVESFSFTTHPDMAVITGLAPAHLDHYPSLEAAGQDIFSLAQYLDDKNVYVNGESESAKAFIKPEFYMYDESGVDGWKVSDVKVGIEGTSFNLSKKSVHLKLRTKLIGRHQIGPLSVVVAIAHKLGLTDKQIEDGVSKTEPFEHRMMPRQVAGAWIIDDTYNGNIDGIKVGLGLLKELKAKRKIYVTPGLVDQGVETESVHLLMGRLIGEAKPDQVVLMKNSVTSIIEKGLKISGYKGELRIEDNPLNFYTNIDQFVAAGDLVLMQNDWPDNYN